MKHLLTRISHHDVRCPHNLFPTLYRRRYPNAFQQAQPQTYDHVYIDLPGILHEVMRTGIVCRVFPRHVPHHYIQHHHPHPTAYTANNNKRFHGALHKKLDEVFQLATPRKTVVLALDGPAPLAKLLTQRCVRVGDGGWWTTGGEGRDEQVASALHTSTCNSSMCTVPPTHVHDYPNRMYTPTWTPPSLPHVHTNLDPTLSPTGAVDWIQLAVKHKN